MDISGIPKTEILTTQFLQTISKITFQKWYSIVKLNAIALIDSGADLNCIKGVIIPTKYCERTNEHLASANGEPLSISYKLNKGYIQNDGYCFKNTSLIVDNITNDIILGTPFLTPIYLFYVNETDVHTKIMAKPVSFKFLFAARQKEAVSLQSSSIFKQLTQNQLRNLQEEVSYLRIEEQLQNSTLQKKISNLEQVIKRKVCDDLPNAF